MTIDDLISETRHDLLDDRVAPYLWSDEQLERYANEAILEASIRAALITKTTTIDISAGTATYNIDSTMRQIILARIESDMADLVQVTEEGLLMFRGIGWPNVEGEPTHFFRRGRTLTLYPKPVADDVLLIFATHIPGSDFVLENDMPDEYHKPLMYYMAYKALLLADADAANPVKAAEYRDMFDRAFGQKKTAKFDTVSHESPLYGTWYGGSMV